MSKGVILLLSVKESRFGPYPDDGPYSDVFRTNHDNSAFMVIKEIASNTWPLTWRISNMTTCLEVILYRRRIPSKKEDLFVKTFNIKPFTSLCPSLELPSYDITYVTWDA